MSNINKKQVKNANRRKVMRQVGKGSAVLAASSIMPHEWIKPVVNAVILPAHAQSTTPTAEPCDDGCDTTLSMTGKSIPSACSGSVWPDIRFDLSVSSGCDDIFIVNIDATLPASGSLSGLSVGDTLPTGSSFSLIVSGLEDSDPAAGTCQPPAAAAGISIDYICVSRTDELKNFSIDVTGEIL